MEENYEGAQEQTLEIGPVKVPKQFAQLGIIVVDGSGSMKEQAAGGISKAQATNNSIRELFTRFKVSRRAPNFAFAIVTFDEDAKIRLLPTNVGDDLDDNADYDPLQGHGGQTKIFKALEEAENVANDFLAAAPEGGVPHSAVILVMSDGVCSDPARTRAVADRIKTGPRGQQVKIASAYFSTVGGGDPAGETLLKAIASDPVLGYKTVYSGAALRDFFEASISAASGGIQIA
jgi:Mg-chelatase subunit ChlD